MTATADSGIESGIADQLAAIVEQATGGPLPLRLRAWDGSEAGPSADTGPAVVVTAPDALRRLVWHPGELGVAQAYVTGEIDVEGDLGEAFRRVWAAGGDGGTGGPPTVRSLVAAAPAAARLVRRVGGLGAPTRPPDSQAACRGRLHSVARDRAAIAHHYDLSNDFYALLLDRRLVYSCGVWDLDDPDATLDDAQTRKLDLVCTKVGLQPGDHLLDVGCGWGATAIHAATEYGATVTGVTLSEQQAAFARHRVRELGLDGKVTIRVQDYRDLVREPEASYDAVTTLEMGEHVGRDNYPRFAAILGRAVRPGGHVLVQQMSRGNTDPGGGPFIEAFIAPDMHMRPLGETVDLLGGAGLEVLGVEGLREHYVRTIAAWHDTFESRWDEAVALVGAETARVWRLYLVGSGLSFEQGRMGVDQILTRRS